MYYSARSPIQVCSFLDHKFRSQWLRNGGGEQMAKGITGSGEPFARFDVDIDLGYGILQQQS